MADSWFVWDPSADAVKAQGFSLDKAGDRFGAVRYTAEDVWWTLGFAISLFALRRVLAYLFFLPAARHLVGPNRPLFLSKFEENCWYIVYYVSSSVLGVYAMRDKRFFSDPFHYWTDFPNDLHRDTVYSMYYYVGAGFYLQTLVALVAFETKRKDFVVMIIHHVVTVLLMTISWCTGNERIGGVVLLLHDIVDIFLYSTKVAHYCGKRFETLTNVLFVTFAIVYGALRMGFFLFRVIITANWAPGYSIASTYIVGHFPDAPAGSYISEAGMCIERWCLSPHWFLTGLMATLYTLHIYWFYLILRMLRRAILVKTVEQDVRSDSEDELLEQEAKRANSHVVKKRK